MSSDYIKEAMRTANSDLPMVRERLKPDSALRLLRAAIGISTEAGEMMDIVKKSLFYGDTLDPVWVAEELGDLFWYMALAADSIGWTFEDIQARNLAKLRERYPGLFTEADALTRDLGKERAALEGNSP